MNASTLAFISIRFSNTRERQKEKEAFVEDARGLHSLKGSSDLRQGVWSLYGFWPEVEFEGWVLMTC